MFQTLVVSLGPRICGYHAAYLKLVHSLFQFDALKLDTTYGNFYSLKKKIRNNFFLIRQWCVN